MSIPLSPQRIKKALHALEKDYGALGAIKSRPTVLSRIRLLREANAVERELAAVEAAAEDDAGITFTAPPRRRLVRLSLKRAQSFINGLRERKAALDAATA